MSTPRTPVAHKRRLPVTIMMTGLVLAAIGLLVLQSHTFLGLPGTNAPPLADLIDFDLTAQLQELANAHPYTRCAATQLRPRNEEYAPAADVVSRLKKLPATDGKLKDNTFVELLVADAPCWGMSNCCETSAYLRPRQSPDLDSFLKTFQNHELRLLYSIFHNVTPKYVLEAGPGAGSTTQMLKLVFPYSVHVAVEADAPSFENLLLNVREVDGVHAVRGALWPSFSLLTWKGGKIKTLTPTSSSSMYLAKMPSNSNSDTPSIGTTINQEAAKSVLQAGGVIGYGVRELKAMFDIPAFDVVFMDVQGAEGILLSPSASDLYWVSEAKVIVFKLHEKGSKAYRVENVMRQIAEVVLQFNLQVLEDENYLYLVSPTTADELGKLVTAPAEQAALGEVSNGDYDGDGDDSDTV